jgi:hypothetical protein
LLEKDPGTGDLRLNVADGKMLGIYYGPNAQPTFLAGEGHEATMSGGKWYRIAQSASAKRANAAFSLRDDISGGGHSTLVFRAGISYGYQAGMGVTVLSNTYYINKTFKKVRILKAGTDKAFYLEVFVTRTGNVRYSITDNLSKDGWVPVDWTETTEIPSGYTACEYDIDKLFMVGGTGNIVSVGHDGLVAVNGVLKVLDSPVLTEASAPSQVVLRSPSNAGSNDSLLMTGTVGGTGAIPAEGAGTRMMWYPEKAAFRAGYVSGTDWDDASIGEYSFATGYDVLAKGPASLATGYATEANGVLSTAFGYGCHASAASSMALGWYNEDRFSELGKTSRQGDNLNSVFEVGIGVDQSSRKNAFTVLQDGSVEVGKDVDGEIPLKVLSDGAVVLSKPQGDISMGVFGQ